jgi:aerobic-type carbon monoxide dehydrogenase small subunit (CoxS/CutS family)
MRRDVELVVNGRGHTLAPEPGETLATTLRDRLHLTGTHVACGRGECGTCTVLLDGEPVLACLTLTSGAGGGRVTTIEGLATAEALHPVQQAFIDHDAVQCGFCTPGQVLAAVALLARHQDPDDEAIRQAMSGNLCRCGTYPRIVSAIRAAAHSLHAPTPAHER